MYIELPVYNGWVLASVVPVDKPVSKRMYWFPFPPQYMNTIDPLTYGDSVVSLFFFLL